ncbi:MAG TPA: hypothetical protein VH353_02285 [Caulobacteraceae bacterium]|nr:hypothetical protein [Caulobacteraceae bacterium]
MTSFSVCPRTDVTSTGASAGREAPTVLTFRCPSELEGLAPPPVPAISGLPDWLRTMPQQAYSAMAAGEDDTVKRCPPFIDAMTGGFLIPLVCDVMVEDGEFSWESDLPAIAGVPRSPIGLHDPSQVAGTPLFDQDSFLIKFHNVWTIQAPEGWSLLITHPVNRFDLPFTTLTGLVDCDRYRDAWIHFPAHWRDANFRGVLPKGTPVAQCFPIRREPWTAEVTTLSEAEMKRARELQATMVREKGLYRRRFRT